MRLFCNRTTKGNEMKREVEVVKVKADTETGWMLINASEYDKDVHGKTLKMDEEAVAVKPSAVDDSMMADEIVALAKKTFKVKLNPEAPVDELIAEFRSLESGV